jgi:hypothetical protein
VIAHASCTLLIVFGFLKQVPAYKPVESLALFEAYLKDNIWKK